MSPTLLNGIFVILARTELEKAVEVYLSEISL